MILNMIVVVVKVRSVDVKVPFIFTGKWATLLQRVSPPARAVGPWSNQNTNQVPGTAQEAVLHLQQNFAYMFLYDHIYDPSR